jgi:hypothetical protein
MNIMSNHFKKHMKPEDDRQHLTLHGPRLFENPKNAFFQKKSEDNWYHTIAASESGPQELSNEWSCQ